MGLQVPWVLRSVAAGTAGTAAMTLAYRTEHRIRLTHHTPARIPRHGYST